MHISDNLGGVFYALWEQCRQGQGSTQLIVSITCFQLHYKCAKLSLNYVSLPHVVTAGCILGFQYTHLVQWKQKVTLYKYLLFHPCTGCEKICSAGAWYTKRSLWCQSAFECNPAMSDDALGQGFPNCAPWTSSDPGASFGWFVACLHKTLILIFLKNVFYCFILWNANFNTIKYDIKNKRNN